MKKLFIFDLDGVLTSTSNEHLEAWTLLGKELNIVIDKSVEEKTKGVSRMDSLNIILDTANVLNKYDLAQKEKMTERKNYIYKKLISNYSRENLFGGVIELFEYLKAKGVLIALGSASRNGPSLLKSLKIEQYFDYIVDPALLRSKPAPDIFLDAAQHFNLKANKCVCIEDAFAGVTAINSANMYSIGIGHTINLPNADIIYEDIASIDYNFLDKLIEEY